MTKAESTPKYSAGIYNTLPNVEEAYKVFSANDGPRQVQSTFRDLFQAHNFDTKFGVGLAHRHTLLNPGEKLVEFNNIMIPWNRLEDGDFLGGKAVADAWMIYEGHLIPCEFIFLPYESFTEDDTLDYDTADDKELHDFAQAFIDTAKTADLEKVICLRRIPRDVDEGVLEVQQNRASIIFKLSQIPPNSTEDSVETNWFFDPKGTENPSLSRRNSYRLPVKKNPMESDDVQLPTSTREAGSTADPASIKPNGVKLPATKKEAGVITTPARSPSVESTVSSVDDDLAAGVASMPRLSRRKSHCRHRPNAILHE